MEITMTKVTLIGMPKYTISYQDVTVTLDAGPVEYDHCVDKLVQAKYPADRMQAVINNYLYAPDEGDHRAEWETMQQWRKTAKLIAKEAMMRCDAEG